MSTAAEIQARYQPLIAAAHERDEARRAADRDRRDFAFITAPHLVCGIPLRALTLPDYLALIAAGNAHVTTVEAPTGSAEEEHFWRTHNVQFMWLLSPGYPSSGARQRLVKQIAAVPFTRLCADLSDYLRETFADAPRAPARAPAAPPPEPEPIGVSFALHWIHRVASSYHWSRAEILALPLKELFQILRLLRAEDRIKAGKPLLAPLDGEADRLWAAMLGEINALQEVSA